MNLQLCEFTVLSVAHLAGIGDPTNCSCAHERKLRCRHGLSSHLAALQEWIPFRRSHRINFMHSAICSCSYTPHTKIYTVSQNKLHKLFVSKLRQMSINFNNFW